MNFRPYFAVVVAASLLVGFLLPTPVCVGTGSSEGGGWQSWSHVAFCDGITLGRVWCRTGGCACVSYLGPCLCWGDCEQCGCFSREKSWRCDCPGEPTRMV